MDGQTRRGEEASNENEAAGTVVSIGTVSALWNGKSGGFRWFPNSTIVKVHEDGMLMSSMRTATRVSFCQIYQD